MLFFLSLFSVSVLDLWGWKESGASLLSAPSASQHGVISPYEASEEPYMKPTLSPFSQMAPWGGGRGECVAMGAV